MEFFSGKLGILTGKVGFFPEIEAKCIKMWPWVFLVFLLAQLGFFYFFRVATLVFTFLRVLCTIV